MNALRNGAEIYKFGGCGSGRPVRPALAGREKRMMPR
jgi:hypothetical protein